jgi:hypothetical protein
MTYSSFDPSKVDVDAAASYANTTDHIIEREEQRKAEELAAEYAALAEEEDVAAQQKKEEDEKDLPVWRRTLGEGKADPDLIAESDLSYGSQSIWGQ